jgi:hypothetical protein
MFVCKECKKEFETVQQLGGHSAKHTKSKQQLIYEQNIKLCKQCCQPISWKSYRFHKKTIEFCCVPCRAKYLFENNSKFGVKVIDTLNNSGD